jgi:inhibitor of KinA sporulation pathway (predicted exonuclease)
MNLLNVIDVEATCWAGDPPAGQASEIIDIGLTVVDLDAGTRLGRHRILVRPDRSRVSAFCTQLTGLTQEEVDTGFGFAAACRALAKTHRTSAYPWASWGDYDRHQIRHQCTVTGTAYPLGRAHVNAKAVFTSSHSLRPKPGMAEALRIAGLPLEGRHYRAEDDAWNIAALVLHLNARGDWPRRFDS